MEGELQAEFCPPLCSPSTPLLGTENTIYINMARGSGGARRVRAGCSFRALHRPSGDSPAKPAPVCLAGGEGDKERGGAINGGGAPLGGVDADLSPLALSPLARRILY